MDKGQKEALVRHVRAGHDTEAACAMLGIPMVEIRRGGKKLQNELSDAFATGSARLRSRLLEGVLGGDGDLRMLANVLEHREATQTASAAKKYGSQSSNPKPCGKNPDAGRSTARNSCALKTAKTPVFA